MPIDDYYSRIVEDIMCQMKSVTTNFMAFGFPVDAPNGPGLPVTSRSDVSTVDVLSMDTYV